MASFGPIDQLGEGNRMWALSGEKMHNAEVFSSVHRAQFATTGERSGRVVTEYSPTAPLQEPCAEGRHYACGSKECSCSCHKTEKKAAPPKAAWVFVGVLIFGIIALLFVCFKTTKHVAPPVAQLSQPAIKFVTFVLVDDIESGLLDRHSLLAETPGENLLDWTGLDMKDHRQSL